MTHERTILHDRSEPPSDDGLSSVSGDATAHDGDGSIDWDIPIGTELGRYVLLDRLGAGAMGLVYSAYDAQLDRKIAIKIVKASRRGGDAAGGGAPRLMREAQALARLSHPNVVPIYDVGVLGDRVWVALEYVEGWTVREWLDRRPRHWRDILDVFAQAGRGLMAAHGAQLVHRDFKPDNVLVDRTGRARVTDFGLARVDNSVESEFSGAPIDSHDSFTESLTRTGSVMGTPGYMSPEQHFGRLADARSDQFAFCVALFEAVYGLRPFAGRTLREVAHAKWTGTMRDPKTLGRRPVGIPRAVEIAIRRGLAGEPDRRWPTMSALVDELERIRRTPRTRLRVASLGIVAIVGAAWAWQARPRECAPGRERLVGIWDDARAQELEQAFASAGTPVSEAAWATTRADFDRYAQSWAGAYDQMCPTSAEVDAAARDAAMFCLHRRRTDLRAAVDALAQGDRATVHRAVAVLDQLEPIEPCLDAGTVEPAMPSDPVLAARVETTREHVADAVARREAGQYALARELARSADEEARALDFPPLTVETATALGVTLGRNDVLDEGEVHLVDAFHTAREHGLDDLALDAAIHLIFLVGVDAGRSDDALEWVRHGEAMLQRLPADDPRRRTRLIENRSLLFVELGRFDEAERGYKEALAVRKELGSGGRAVAMVHNNYGNLLAGRRRYPEALAQHEAALALRVERLGRRHPEVAMSILNTARIHLEQFRYDEGLALLDEGEAIIAETLGEEHSMMATALNMRGIALLRSDHPARAHKAFERSLAIRMRLYGPNHLEVAEAWNTMGATCMEEGDLDAAETAFLRARAIFEAHGAAARVSMLRIRANLGSLAVRRHEYAEAERMHSEVLAELEQAIGVDNPELVATLQPLSVALLGLGRPGEAVPYIERALRLQRIADSSQHALDYLEFLRLRADIDLGHDRPQAHAQIRRIAERLRSHAQYADQAREVDAWLAANP